MQAVKRDLYSPEEYLALEREASFKSEYYDGEIFAMSGGTLIHSLIQTNLGGLLMMRLMDRPCRVLNSDMRVKVEATTSYTYPDISVVCGAPQLEDARRDSLLNPVLLIEVLSPSSERFDRRGKFDIYRQIPSLKEYVLVSQDEMRVERYLRQPNEEWSLRVSVGPDAEAVFSSIEVSLRLSDIYHKVELPPAEPPPLEARMSQG